MPNKIRKFADILDMNMKKTLILTILGLFTAVSMQAQVNEFLTFTRIERNPRAAALAGAGAASVTNVAYASFNNAAVVPFFEENGDFGLGYQSWAPKTAAINAFNFGGAYNFGLFGVTAGAVYQMEKPDEDGFTPSALQVNLGAGVRILPWLGFGVNARFAQDNLFQGMSYNGFAADALVLFNPVKGLNLTAGVSNIGNNVSSRSGSQYPQPVSVKAAAAYYLQIGCMNSLEFMVDEDYYINSKANAVSFGMEYSFNQIAYVRTGYRLATERAPFASHLALGLGAQFAGFRIDVSYITLSEAIGNTISVGIGYRFSAYSGSKYRSFDSRWVD